MTVSQEAIAKMMAEATDACPVVLLTITHPDLSEPIRVCSNGVAVISRGHTYQPYPFEVMPPPQGGDGQPSGARIVIDNVDRTIALAVRSAGTTPPVVKAELVLSTSPDVVEETFFELPIREVEIDALTVSCQLGNNDPAKEPCPMLRFTPASFPGLH